MDDVWWERSAPSWGRVPGTPSGTPASGVRLPFPWDGGIVLGLLLLLVAVLIGVRFAEEVDRRVPVWAARAALPVGARVTPETVTVVRVRLAAPGGAYVSATVALPRGLVAVRTVGRGELLPRAAVRPAASLGVRPVPVPVRGPLSRGIQPGGLVDVWVSPARARYRGAPRGRPQLLLRGAGVYSVGARVTEATGTRRSDAASGPRGAGGDARCGPAGDDAGSGLEEVGVEVLVATRRLPEVLDLLALGEHLVLLPVPGEAPPGEGRPGLPSGGSR